MSSLPLGGDFIKFATKNHCLPSVDGPRPVFYCASTGYFAAPQNTHSCIPVNKFYIPRTWCPAMGILVEPMSGMATYEPRFGAQQWVSSTPRACQILSISTFLRLGAQQWVSSLSS